MSQGQTAARGALTVMARVRYVDAASVSPGNPIVCSSRVEPQFISQGCKTARNRPHKAAKIANAPMEYRTKGYHLMNVKGFMAVPPLGRSTGDKESSTPG